MAFGKAAHYRHTGDPYRAAWVTGSDFIVDGAQNPTAQTSAAARLSGVFRGLLTFVLLLELMSAANNLFAICSKTVRAIRLLPEFEDSIQCDSP
jgi:hypothetical protein